MTALPDVGYDGHGGIVVQVTEHWIVVVTPMIYNDRIQIASHEEYGRTWTAGWCYSRDPARSTMSALIAAALWDPETETEPEGHQRTAYDARNGALL